MELSSAWYNTYAWESRFPFQALLLRKKSGPLSLFEPEALQLMDRAIVWLECHFKDKGYALPPRPEGTRAELFLLLSHFQIVQSLMRDTGPTDLRLSHPFNSVTSLFLKRCPPPPDTEGGVYLPPPTSTLDDVKAAFRITVLAEPLPHVLDWNPVFVDGSVFRRMKQTLSEDHDLFEESERRFDKAAA